MSLNGHAPLLMQRYPELALWDKGLLEAFFRRAATKTFAEGQRLNTEGKPSEFLAFTLSGTKRIHKMDPSGKEVTLDTVEAGQMCSFNTLSALTGEPFPAQVHIVEDCEMLTVPVEDVRAAFEAHPQVRDFLLRQLHADVTELVTLLSEITFKRVNERLRAYLLRQARNHEVRATHQAIADDLGTSREVISKLLKEFERQGELKMARGHILLRQGFA